jgi:hypothetical protein
MSINYPVVSQDRLNLMYEGVMDLEWWLNDLFRKGPDTILFDNLLIRLNDFQLNGVSTFLKNHIPTSDLLPQQLAIVVYFIKRYRFFFESNQYPDIDTLLFAGVHLKKGNIIENEPKIYDEWCVLGLEFGEEANLIFRKTWLGGRTTGMIALILDFKRPREEFLNFYDFQKTYAGHLVFYPSAYPIRAISLDLELINGDFNTMKCTENIHEPFIKNPYIFEIPVWLKVSSFRRMKNGNVYLIDLRGRMFRTTDVVEDSSILGLWSGSLLKIIPLPFSKLGQNEW